MLCLDKKNPDNLSGLLAGGQGFEPRLTVPETAVLPLDEPPPAKEFYHFHEPPSIVSGWKVKVGQPFFLAMVKFGDK